MFWEKWDEAVYQVKSNKLYPEDESFTNPLMTQSLVHSAVFDQTN